MCVFIYLEKVLTRDSELCVGKPGFIVGQHNESAQMGSSVRAICDVFSPM